MDDFRKIYWGAIFSVGGIIIGWILNQTAIWLKSRNDDKKTLKVVLFHLLETYFLFIRCDFDKQMQKFGKKVIEKLPKEQRPDDIEEANLFIKQISSLLMGQLIASVQEELEENQKKYFEAVHNLATIDPITAYYLNTQKNILQTFDSLNVGFQTVESELVKMGVQMSPEIVFEKIKPNIYNEAIKDLENDLKNISWKINPLVWIRTNKAIGILKGRVNADIDSQMDSQIDEILKHFESMEGNQFL